MVAISSINRDLAGGERSVISVSLSCIGTITIQGYRLSFISRRVHSFNAPSSNVSSDKVGSKMKGDTGKPLCIV